MFSYTLRHSKKAKYLQLRLNPEGLSVVVPVGLAISKESIEEFLQQKKSWIEKHLKCYEKSVEQEKQVALPTTINLQAFNKTWEVIYLEKQHRTLRLVTNARGQIYLIGKITETVKVFILLKRWLKRAAEQFLREELTLLSERVGLNFNTMAVRFTKTRWGSCSRQKKIHLNAQLVFLPAHLMRHVLLHELCHIKYLHHKKSFWDLLESLDPNAKNHAKQLKLAVRYIPSWIIK